METGFRKHEHRTLPESFAASKVWSRPIMDSEFEIMDTQVDMFDSPLTGSVKGETSLMEYPFFDLSKRGRTKAFRFSDGRVQISVRAPDGQIATIYDKDIQIGRAHV